MQVENHQLIISYSDENPPTLKVPLISVSRELRSEDISKIQMEVDSFGTSALINELDFYKMNESSNVDAIKFLINKAGYVNLLPYFMKREVMSPTDIGNMVALPHPFLKGSESRAKIIVGINQHEIPWGHQLVRLVIIYIPTADLKTNKSFFNDVYQRTSQLTTVQQLLKTVNKEQFIKVWNEKGDHKNVI
ncbi:PTS sugar transporter subunit IIA [Lactiplantibacillus carotarum]|uniref:PTS sugar transporter subunit IIA n=1 Tax=Lactiplantibacillus carotarum TaxID=2993456 RepID=UPI00298EE609|nr:PTS sugar transporter subunit IIA [Lactiplantibacillus carotarum]